MKVTSVVVIYESVLNRISQYISALLSLIPGVARTWFGFHYQEPDKDSIYYSFNVMHIDSQRKDHGLLTQLHGPFEKYDLFGWDFGEETDQKKFYSRTKTIKGKRSNTGYMVDNLQDSNFRFCIKS